MSKQIRIESYRTTSDKSTSGSSGGFYPGGGNGGGTVEANFDIIQGEGIGVKKTNVDNLIYTISHDDTSDAISFEKVDKKALAGISLDDFGHVAGYETCDILALDDLDKRYILKQQNDVGYGFYTWEAGFMTKSTIRSAEYNIGWEAEKPTGWSVTETGTAWYTSLNVRGPILSNNIIGSPYYASGWTGFGSQWDLSKHRLETDFVSVRKELRVYALDVFRIYGTNGDLAVSTTNKIDRVEDMGTVWRCHIDDYDGEMYMNMRIDDIVKCQTWEKKSGRYYMARVTDINNTWFELSKTLLEGETTPAKGDVLIRWDNLTNADRKGLLYLSASDNYAPYMDVRYGDWNATFGTIKVRNGRLDGINDPAFPELYGAQNNFGLYTCNFYGTGELILRSTGESISRTFEVLKDSIKMGLDEVRYEIQVSQDSILSNPIFKDDTTGWEITNVIYPWTINGGLLAASGNPFVNFISGAVRVIDPVNDRTVLQVTDSTVTQRNAIFTDRKPGKYALRFAYRSLLGFGGMEVGVSGSPLRISVPLSENQEYQKAEIISDWDGTGDFIIKVTGGIVNITDISFTSDKLANAINEIKVYYDTKLTFYAEKAVMNSFREEYDKFNQVVKKDYATQTWTYNAINTEVGTIVNGKLTNYSTTSQTSTLISNAVYNLNLGQYATTEWTSNQIRNSVVDLTGYATQSWTSKQITSSVSNKANTSYVDQAADALSIRIQGAESITDAFYKFDSTRMMTNRRIEIGSGGGTGFVASAGFAPSSIGPAFWCGSTFANRENASIKLSHDGSGWLAKKNIMWDTNGNTTFRGRVESKSSGDRVIIDPYGKVSLFSGSYEVLQVGFQYGASMPFPSLNLRQYTTNGSITQQSILQPGSLQFFYDGTRRMFIGGSGLIIIDPTYFPNKPNLANMDRGTIYRDNDTLKIKL